MRLLKLLGVPKLVTEDDMVDIPPKQILLLASYLAYKEDWCSRDELLHLFWPDESEKVARHNLSQLLYHGKGQSWLSGLETERNRVRWLIDSDVKAFHSALGDGDWGAAGDRYAGNLLAGVRLEMSPNFEAWLEQERETLEAAWRTALSNHAQALHASGKTRQALGQLQKILKHDELAEDILQSYLQLALEAGECGSALKTFDSFCKQLKKLDLSPLKTTVDLAEALRSSQDSPSLPASLRKNKLFNSPTGLTPFIGRDLERHELTRFLLEDDRRLVTLLGPGGVGKTRLAMQLAQELASQFADGAVFVPLAGLESETYLARTVLEALSQQAPNNQDKLSFLKTFLSAKQMLLVMDNAEHLPDSAILMTELLDSVPDLTLLVTSRNALEVQGESIYDLRGLLYPQLANSPLEDYDAATFFLRSARRAHPAFSVTADNKSSIAKLCQLLNGMPLALELAATWVRLLSPGELVEEIAKSLDALESHQKNISARHQSMRAVLEHSWQLLSDTEQDALRQLAVFQGGFSKDAAHTVAKASLRTLLTLVNKSLLQRNQKGRFERLLVVQQYCFEKLLAQTGQLEQSRQAHAEFFLALAEEARPKLDSEEKALWLDTLARDHTNLRSALRWLIDSHNETLGLRLGNALFPFWWLRGYYREGLSFLTELIGLSNTRSSLRAKALTTAGSLARLCEDLPGAKALYEQSLAITRDLGDASSIAATLGNLGMIHRLEGGYEKAKELVEESIAIYEQTGEKARVANGVNNLAAIAMNLGNKEEAWQLNEKSLKLANELGERFIAARSLGNLGALALEKADLERAQALREASLKVFEELEYRVGIAVTQQGLGDIFIVREDYMLARQKYLTALQVFTNLNDTRGIAEVLDSMSELMMALNYFDKAFLFRGAASQVLADLGIRRQPEESAALDRQTKQGIDKLGQDKVEQLLAKGASLSVEEATNAMLEPVNSRTDKPVDKH